MMMLRTEINTGGLCSELTPVSHHTDVSLKYTANSAKDHVLYELSFK